MSTRRKLAPVGGTLVQREFQIYLRDGIPDVFMEPKAERGGWNGTSIRKATGKEAISSSSFTFNPTPNY